MGPQFSNVSPLWTHNWLAYIQDDPINPGNNVKRIIGGGGGYDYDVVQSQSGLWYDTTTGGFIPETYDNSQLVRIPATGAATSYVRNLPSGGKETYGLSNGAATAPRIMFLTSVTDPQGNTTTLNYDSQFRLTSIVDAMGRSTTFTYGLSGYPLLITKITDPFGRYSQLAYDTSQRLSSITDPVGITSTFTYSSSEPNFVTNLTTPYGISKFSDIPNPSDPTGGGYVDRSLAMTDPLGNVELLYFYQQASVTGTPEYEDQIPVDLLVDDGYLEWRNAYHWDRHAAAGGNVTTDSNGNPTAEKWTLPSLPAGANLPTVYHWFHLCCQINYASNQLGSIKKPFEKYRLWINYPNMPTNGYYTGSLIAPRYVGRVLDDSSSQVYQATYNAPSVIPTPGVAYGNLLSKTDPAGRATLYNYASNNIDLLTVQQLTTSPSTYTTIKTFGSYNTQHEPQTYTGADGQTWHYTYNAAGQLATVTDPNTGVTTYNYDSIGRLSTVQNANLATVLTLTYDSADRVHTRTDSEGYTLTYAYDNLDRVTKITYPDNTTDQYDYTFQSGPLMGTESLDVRKHTDRLGRVTTYAYDADRRLTSVTEPITATTTRTTSYNYYENGVLKDIIDADGNDTHWEIDVQSRPTSKTYGYGTPSAQTETYTYEVTNSRLHSITDALGQVKTFTYAPDNHVTNVTYTSTVNPFL
jgi:YD repeat-containing protein